MYEAPEGTWKCFNIITYVRNNTTYVRDNSITYVRNEISRTYVIISRTYVIISRTYVIIVSRTYAILSGTGLVGRYPYRMHGVWAMYGFVPRHAVWAAHQWA